ncbi:putative elongation factor 1-gamma (EF-1-gamma) [Trypanosoma cruzi]|nr:putative elongation factor 1-gamma (EF-1-gamma) [Trypanosoma cruzi]
MQCVKVRLIRVWLQAAMANVRPYAFCVVLMIGAEWRHDIVALCVLRGRGMAAIVREVADTELLDWEVADVAAQRERMAAACGGRARRSRGLRWRGTC